MIPTYFLKRIIKIYRADLFQVVLWLHILMSLIEAIEKIKFISEHVCNVVCMENWFCSNGINGALDVDQRVSECYCIPTLCHSSHIGLTDNKSTLYGPNSETLL